VWIKLLVKPFSCCRRIWPLIPCSVILEANITLLFFFNQLDCRGLVVDYRHVTPLSATVVFLFRLLNCLWHGGIVNELEILSRACVICLSWMWLLTCPLKEPGKLCLWNCER
jgi:hypothetical protein